MESSDRETWWVIEQSMLLAVLCRAAGGENPDMLLLELTANSAHETIEGD